MNLTYEFVLWPNCHNDCSFCFQKEQIRRGVLRTLTDDEYAKSVTRVIEFLHAASYTYGSNVMLVGGELFDYSPCMQALHPLLKEVISLLKNGSINELYLNTNLIYKQIYMVFAFIQNCKDADVISKLHFTTSYDFDGRFCKGTENLMLRNLQALTNSYPECPVYVNTMLSKRACELIVHGKFSVREFASRYKCYVNLIPYIELIPEITAERSLIIKALQKVDQEIPGYVTDYLTRLDINQEKRVYQYNPDKDLLEDCSCATLPCGHAVNFARYSRGSTCYICDMKLVFGL